MRAALQRRPLVCAPAQADAWLSALQTLGAELGRAPQQTAAARCQACAWARQLPAQLEAVGQTVEGR